MKEYTNQELLNELESRLRQDKPGTITPYYYRNLFAFQDRKEPPTSPLSLVPDVLKFVCNHRTSVSFTSYNLAQWIYDSGGEDTINLVDTALHYLLKMGVLKEAYWGYSPEHGKSLFWDDKTKREADEGFAESGKWYADGYEVSECPYYAVLAPSDELKSKDGTLVTN